MYVLGHISLAYLPLAAYLAIARKRLEPGAFLAFLFFANIQDAIHVGIVREFSHNLLGTVLMFIGLFLLLKKARLVNRSDAGIMAYAAAMHVVGDFLFSGFNPLFPFINNPTTVWGWNSPEHIAAEAGLNIAFVCAAFALGDWVRLRQHIAERVRKFYQQKWFPMRDWYYYPLYLYAVMMSISIIQFAIGIHYNLILAEEGLWYAILFLAGFIGYLLALSSALYLKRTAGLRS